MVDALSLKMDRTLESRWSSFSVEMQNTLDLRRHEVQVAAPGKPDYIDQQMKSLGALVSSLASDEHVSKKKLTEGMRQLTRRDDATRPENERRSTPLADQSQKFSDRVTAEDLVRDGKLVVTESGPVRPEAAVSLRKIVSDSSDRLTDYREQPKAERDGGKGSNGKSEGKPGATTESEAGKESVAVNRYASSLAKKFDDGISQPETLKDTSSAERAPGASLLVGLGRMKDPANAELSMLPDGDRQKLLTQAQAVLVKIDSKELGEKASYAMNQGKPGDTPRDKLAQFVALDHVHDPEFAQKAMRPLKELEKQGMLSADQVKTAATAIGAKEAVQEASPAFAEKPAEKTNEKASASVDETPVSERRKCRSWLHPQCSQEAQP